MDKDHFRDPQHDAVERWERRWLALSGLMSLTFVILIAYALTVEGAHIAQLSPDGRAQPEQLLNHPVFASPGVRALGGNRFQVSLVAQTYSFNPPDIVLPRGAHVTFYATSRDVIHGFQLENTNLNVELIPGEIATFQYTFDELGDYRVACNEYCGIGHQNMLGRVRVLNPSDLVQERAKAPADTETAGARIYSSNCASCHGPQGEGQAGLWPPLAQHAAQLFNADRAYLPRLLLYGLSGEIEVAGNSYNGQMPAWRQLNDNEIAGVLNDVLSHWDNEALTESFEPYRAEEITPLRDEALAPSDMYALRQQLELP